jgi:ketosteroid isomerase-like protein
MTTPFDNPQAELAWMFLQCLGDGEIDECFELLSDDFTYWSIADCASIDKAALQRRIEQRRTHVEISLHLIRCVYDVDSVVLEAHGEAITADGSHYDSPYVFFCETRDGLIVSIREYNDTRLASVALPNSTS